MQTTFKAIAEPNRRRILELIDRNERTAGEIADHFSLTRPAISQHLTVLRDAGLVSQRRLGTRRLYLTRPQGLASAQLFIEGFWDDRLDRLRDAAERQSDSAVQEMTERVAVQRETAIAAPPDVVWGLLTDPDRVTEWMGLAAALDPTPRGSYRVEVVPGQVAMGEFVEVDRPYRLSHTWGWEGTAGEVVPVGSTIVTYDLVPTDTGTLLRLTHRDLPGIGSAGSHSRGWGHYLDRLADVAEGGSPGVDPWTTDPDRLADELTTPE